VTCICRSPKEQVASYFILYLILIQFFCTKNLVKKYRIFLSRFWRFVIRGVKKNVIKKKCVGVFAAAKKSTYLLLTYLRRFFFAGSGRVV
jgi:hypothetical protein